jgi:hypothetical protein
MCQSAWLVNLWFSGILKIRLFNMIERYTIKFGPAISQKELEKALHEDGETPNHTNLTKMKARIEFIGDFDDIKRVKELLKSLSKK